MKIKVCGMRTPENITELVTLDLDYMGYIFYGKSSRNVTRNPKVKIPVSIQKVGVFVNESIENIQKKVEEYQLDVIQLHGDESPEFCQKISGKAPKIIKAFSVGDYFDFNITAAYQAHCDLFLFDAKGESYGGNGTTFDWTLVKKYAYNVPFMLSGGINLEHIDTILAMQHKKMIGIDVNSGFELSPAIKDVGKVKKMIKKIRSYA